MLMPWQSGPDTTVTRAGEPTAWGAASVFLVMRMIFSRSEEGGGKYLTLKGSLWKGHTKSSSTLK